MVLSAKSRRNKTPRHLALLGPLTGARRFKRWPDSRDDVRAAGASRGFLESQRHRGHGVKVVGCGALRSRGHVIAKQTLPRKGGNGNRHVACVGHLTCPGGAKACSQGREPLVTLSINDPKPRRGDGSLCLPSPLRGFFVGAVKRAQGLAPLATCCRPAGPGCLTAVGRVSEPFIA